jgi:DNA-directed RNA polymerase specialized sigma24 family protein
MAQSTDAQVLRRVQSGEQSAFEILFDRYYARILEYAVCVLQDEVGARAAAARTFVEAYRDARRQRPRGVTYPAHLYRICRRQIHRDYPRLFCREAIAYGTIEAEVWVRDLEELPLSIILRRERDSLIRTAIEGLSAADREIIHLAFAPDLSRRDLASILRQPSDAALMARLYRAVRRLSASVLQAGLATPALQGSLSNCVDHWART